MTRDAEQNTPTGVRTNPITVHVDLNSQGGWEVVLPDQPELITLETLDDARRVAYLCAAHGHPCELIVCDAHHQVLHREFINGHLNPTGRPRSQMSSRAHDRASATGGS